MVKRIVYKYTSKEKDFEGDCKIMNYKEELERFKKLLKSFRRCGKCPYHYIAEVKKRTDLYKQINESTGFSHKDKKVQMCDPLKDHTDVPTECRDYLGKDGKPESDYRKCELFVKKNKNYSIEEIEKL